MQIGSSSRSKSSRFSSNSQITNEIGRNYVKRDFISENIQACSRNSTQTKPKLSRIESEESDVESDIEDMKTPKKRHSKHKFHLIKRTTCAACMEKWKIPLPAPKTPKLRTSMMRQEHNNELMNHYWNSSHNNNRVSLLINKEMYKLDAYNRRYSNEGNGRNNVSGNKVAGVQETVTDSHQMEMKRDELENRRRATQERLENFLRNTI